MMINTIYWYTSVEAYFLVPPCMLGVQEQSVLRCRLHLTFSFLSFHQSRRRIALITSSLVATLAGTPSNSQLIMIRLQDHTRRRRLRPDTISARRTFDAQETAQRTIPADSSHNFCHQSKLHWTQKLLREMKSQCIQAIVPAAEELPEWQWQQKVLKTMQQHWNFFGYV